MTQTAMILTHLKTHGDITPLVALRRYGCFRLAARIYDLRTAGHEIKTDSVSTQHGAQVARYALIEKKDVPTEGLSQTAAESDYTQPQAMSLFGDTPA